MPAIEQRVVEMKFDNKNFNNNVHDTIDSLDDLKKSLALNDAAKGLQNLQKAGDNFNLNGMEEAAGRVQNALSQLAVKGLESIQGLSSKVSAELSKMFNQMAIEPITSGWSKYADKTAAIQTIMAATSKQWTDEAERMEKVQEQLGILNWFTDETSYKFLDMVQNIGKFTSAGVELQPAVTAMQGISTWAAVSGANVNEAGRAMYNLSQAMATGAVKLMDWKSIENANMATVEFKETVIETAEAAGELVKAGDHWVVKGSDMVVTAQNFNESLSKGWFTSEVLMKSLNKYGHAAELIHELGEEADLAARDVVEMAEAYRDGSLDLNQASEETGMSVDDLSKKLKVLASDEEALGLKAFKAAYETKTFQEAIDYVKESASSLWMNIYENIFGNYVETKKVWGALVDELYEVFLVPLENVNDLLGSWHELGGFEDFWTAIGNIWQTIKNIARPISEAWNLIFPPMLGYQLADITKKFRDWSEGLLSAFEWAGSLADVISEPYFALRDAEQAAAQKAAEFKGEVDKVANSVEKALDPIERTKKALEDGIVDEIWAGKWGNGQTRWDALNEQGLVWEMIQNAVNESDNNAFRYAITEESIARATKNHADAAEDLAKAEDKYAKSAEKANKEQDELSNTLDRNKSKQLEINEDQAKAEDSTYKVLEKRRELEAKLTDEKRKTIKLYEEEGKLQDAGYENIEATVNQELIAQKRVENIHKAAVGVFAIIGTIKDILVEAGKMLADVGGYALDKMQPLMDIALDIAGSIGEAATHFYVLNKQANVVGAAFKKIGDALKRVIDGIGAGFTAFAREIRKSQALKNFTAAWKRFGDLMKDLYDKVLSKIKDFFGTTDFEKSGDSIGTFLAKFAEAGLDKLADALNWIVDHKEDIKEFFGIFTNGLGSAIDYVGKALGNVGDAIATKGLGGAIAEFFGAIGEGFSKAISGLGNIISNEKVQEFWNKITERFGNMDLGKIATIFASGAGGIFLLELVGIIKKFTGGIGDALDNFKKVPEKIVGVLDGLIGALSAYQMKLKADVLWTIAKAIGVLALALFGLSLIPPEELEGATAALVTVMGMLMGVMAVYTKMKGIKVSAKDNALATFLQGIQEAMQKAIKMAGMGVLLVGFSVAVAVLIGALLLVSKIDWGTFLSNVGKLLVIAGILVVSMTLLSLFASRIPKGMGGALVGFAISIIAVAGAMMLIAKIPTEQLKGVTLALMGVIAAMAIFAFAMSFSDNGRAFIGFGIGILAIAAGLAVLAVPLLVLSAIPWDNLKHAADILGGLLLALVAAAVIMKVFQTSGKALINLALALVILGGALALVGVLALPAALGLGIIAGAIILLIGATLLLGGLAPMLETVVASIYALSAAALQFALAGLALSAALFVLGLALPTLADGLVAFGEQLKVHGLEIALAVGFIILTVVAAIGAASVIKAITGTAVKWITALAKGLTEALPTLLDHLWLTISIVLLFLATVMPGIVDKLLTLLESIINSLAEGIRKHGPAILNAVMNLLSAIFTGILGTIWGWISPILQPIFSLLGAAWNVIWGWLGPLVSGIAAIIRFLYNIVKAFFEGIAAGVGWITGLFQPFFDWVHEKFSGVFEWLSSVGDKIKGLFGGGKEVEDAAAAYPEAAANGIANNSDTIKDAATTAIAEGTAGGEEVAEQNGEAAGNAYMDKFQDIINNGSGEIPSFDAWQSGANTSLEGVAEDNANTYTVNFADYLNSDTTSPDAIVNLMKNGGAQGDTEASTQGVSTGENFDLGIVSGLGNQSGTVFEKVRALAKGMKRAINEELDEHSPSREAAKIAEFFDLGLVRGLDDNADKVESSARSVARKMLDCINSLAEDANSMFEDGINTNPVISPVLDLENLQNGVHGIDDLFGGTSFSMSGSMGGYSRNELMELRMGRMFQQQMADMADRLTDSERDRSYEFTIPVEIDGRQVAKSTAVYTNEELEKINRRNNRKVGIV